MDEKDKERMRGIQWSQKDIDELVVGEHAPLAIYRINDLPGRSAGIDTPAQARVKNLKAGALMELVSALTAPKIIDVDLASGPDETALTEAIAYGTSMTRVEIDLAGDLRFTVIGLNSIYQQSRRCICCGAPEGEVQHD